MSVHLIGGLYSGAEAWLLHALDALGVSSTDETSALLAISRRVVERTDRSRISRIRAGWEHHRELQSERDAARDALRALDADSATALIGSSAAETVPFWVLADPRVRPLLWLRNPMDEAVASDGRDTGSRWLELAARVPPGSSFVIEGHDADAALAALARAMGLDGAAATASDAPELSTADPSAAADDRLLRLASAAYQASAVLEPGSWYETVRAMAETVAMLDERDRRAKATQLELERLASRRSVRLALGVAERARPIVRMFRQPDQSRRQDRSRSTQVADRAPTTPPTPHAPAPQPLVERLADGHPVTIIVPVFNALPDLKRCLAALARNTTAPSRLLIVDDASDDPAVTAFLDSIEHPAVEVLRLESNRGFAGAVNAGLARTVDGGDIVILNSDTEVTPRWLEHLILTASSDATTATVTPLGNNAGAFSAPEIEGNDRPPGMTWDELGRLVTRHSARRFPEAPTGNGFCMLIRRAALSSIGDLDETTFPRGYGEETDLCLRASAQGWRHVVDDRTLVAHARGASFGPERTALMRDARTILDNRYPEYPALVTSFLASSDMAAARAGVAQAIRAGAANVRPRVLHVFQEGQGGVPATSRDLIDALVDRYEGLALTSNTKHLKVLARNSGSDSLLEQFDLVEPLRFPDTTNAHYREFVADVMERYGIELVHVRHLVKHTFDVVSVAAATGRPVVLSLHDYYLTCPTIHLLDNADRFCAGRCTPGQGHCRIPMTWLETVPHLKHGWVHSWRERVARLLEDVDLVVTTSETVRDIHIDANPAFGEVPIAVVEHGRDLGPSPEVRPPIPMPDQPVRILVPGNLDFQKGAGVLEELIRTAPSSLFEVHLLGRVPPELAHLGVLHGPYERGSFPNRVAEIAPSLVALLSPWGETYSHTLTEAWHAGLPVIAADRGALAERVRTHGGGWLVNVEDVPSITELIETIRRDEREYARVLASIPRDGWRSRDEMAADYADLYQRVIASRRPFEGLLR